MSTNKNFEILKEDISNYDFSFKIIIVGNPGNIIIFYLKINKFRCWEKNFTK